MLFRRKLVMFGPREVLLTSDEPVVRQFLNGRRIGPIGMSEEKDEATMAEEQAHLEAGHVDAVSRRSRVFPRRSSRAPGMPERKAVGRRQARSARTCTCCRRNAQEAILESLEGTNNQSVRDYDSESRPAPRRPDTASIPHKRGYLTAAWAALATVRFVSDGPPRPAAPPLRPSGLLVTARRAPAAPPLRPPVCLVTARRARLRRPCDRPVC